MEHSRSRWRKLRFFFAGLALVPLPYLSVLFRPDQALLYRDLSAVQIPMRALWVRALSELHRIPHWDPFHWSGAPFLADPTQAPLYPLNWLLLFFCRPENMARGMVWFLLLHHALLYAGAYPLLRRQRVRPALAAAGALALAWCGFAMSTDNLLHTLGAQLAVPFFFLSFTAALRPRAPAWALPAAAAALAWPVYAGDPQITYVLALAAPFFFRRAGIGRQLGAYLFTIFGALCVAAPQLGPTLRHLVAVPGGAPLEAQLVWSFHPLRWLELAFPLLLGSTPDSFRGQGLLNHPEFRDPFIFSVYAGASLLAPLLIFFFARCRRVRWWRRHWPKGLGLALLAFAAMGAYSPVSVYPFLYRALPLWGGFRYPERLTYWLVLAAVLGGALSAERLLRLRRVGTRPLLAASGAFLLAALLTLAWRVGTGGGEAPLFWGHLFFSAALIAIWRGQRHAGFALAAVVLFDFARFAPNLVWPYPLALTAPSEHAEKILRDRAKLAPGEAARMYSEDRYQLVNPELLHGLPLSAAPIARQWEFLIHNLPSYYGIETVQGYSTLAPATPLAWRAGMPVPELLAIQSARYVLLREKDGTVSLTANKDALPYVTFPRRLEAFGTDVALAARLKDPSWDPRSSALVRTQAGEAAGAWKLVSYRRKWDGIDAVVEAERAGPGWLLVNESYDEGWRTKVNGVLVAPVEANGWAMVLPLPAAEGKVAIELRYRDDAYRGGLVVFATWLVFVVVASLVAGRTRRPSAG